jgi:hypothetical protein
MDRKKMAKMNVTPKTLSMLRRMYSEFKEHVDDEEEDSGDVKFEKFVEMMVSWAYKKDERPAEKELVYIG